MSVKWEYNSIECKVENWLGKVLDKIGLSEDKREMLFHFADGDIFRMCNLISRICFVDVWCEEIIGDLDDLIGSPLTMAEEVSNVDHAQNDYNEGSHTWTFYKFSTAKGYVTLRWLGTSNGFYSEDVDIMKRIK